MSLQVGGFWKASVSQRFPSWSRVTSHGKAAAHVSGWFARLARPVHTHTCTLSAAFLSCLKLIKAKKSCKCELQVADLLSGEGDRKGRDPVSAHESGARAERR